MICDRPPEGWSCSREADHYGPCAASPSPDGTRFVAIAKDGTGHDVTEDVGALYDLVVGSMDFGSGFLTIEDAEPLARLADLAGYKDPDKNPGSTHPTLIDQARAQLAAKGIACSACGESPPDGTACGCFSTPESRSEAS